MTKNKKRSIKAPLHKKATKRLHLLVVPQRSNSYRPHLIRRYGLMAVALVAFALPVLFGGVSSDNSVLGDESKVTPESVYQATNKQRAAKGLATLEPNDKLSSAAAKKAHHMLNNDYWAHTSPSGVTPWHWFGEVDYKYSIAGENLAKNFGSADSLLSAWMASPEHRANVLGDQYEDIGIAVVRGDLNGKATELIVALYGAPETNLGALGAQTTAPTFAAQASLTTMDRLLINWQTLSPVAAMSIVMLFVATSVALLAHFYRTKLPKPLRQSWYRHHGLYKAMGMGSLVIVLVALYGGGQI